MDNKFNFDQNLIQQAEADYGRLTLSATQRMMIESLSKVFNQYLNISEVAMKGFLFRVARDYQVKYKVVLDDGLDKLNPAKRMEIAETIVGMLTDSLTRVLVSRDQKPQMDKAIKNAFDVYKDQLAKL